MGCGECFRCFGIFGFVAMTWDSLNDSVGYLWIAAMQAQRLALERWVLVHSKKACQANRRVVQVLYLVAWQSHKCSFECYTQCYTAMPPRMSDVGLQYPPKKIIYLLSKRHNLEFLRPSLHGFNFFWDSSKLTSDYLETSKNLLCADMQYNRNINIIGKMVVPLGWYP